MGIITMFIEISKKPTFILSLAEEMVYAKKKVSHLSNEVKDVGRTYKKGISYSVYIVIDDVDIGGERYVYAYSGSVAKNTSQLHMFKYSDIEKHIIGDYADYSVYLGATLPLEAPAIVAESSNSGRKVVNIRVDSIVNQPSLGSTTRCMDTNGLMTIFRVSYMDDKNHAIGNGNIYGFDVLSSLVNEHRFGEHCVVYVHIDGVKYYLTSNKGESLLTPNVKLACRLYSNKRINNEFSNMVVDTMKSLDDSDAISRVGCEIVCAYTHEALRDYIPKNICVEQFTTNVINKFMMVKTLDRGYQYAMQCGSTAILSVPPTLLERVIRDHDAKRWCHTNHNAMSRKWLQSTDGNRLVHLRKNSTEVSLLLLEVGGNIIYQPLSALTEIRNHICRLN